MTLSKSNFVLYKSCPKKMWLHINKPEAEVPEFGADTHIREGKEVGDLAKQYFNNVIDVTSYKEDGSLDFENMIGLTYQHLLEGNTIIAEATFSINELFCSVDILKPVDGGYEIYEVKATTEVKAEHQIDAAFQKHLLESRGLNVVGVYIMHLNGDYIRHGELNLNELFLIENIEEKRTYKSTLKKIEDDIISAKEILSLDEDPNIGFCGKCKKCQFKNYCYRNLPTPNVTDIWDIDNAYKLLNQGIITFEDVRNSEFSFDAPRQVVQFEAHFNNLDLIVNKDGIKSFLDTIKYPIYHLDFESYMFAIPPCDGAWPYEQIPTQYSLHIEYEDERLEHKEFLGDSIDPRRAFAESLIRDIPGDSSVLVFNIDFEGKRLDELIEMFPDLAEDLLKIKNRIVDLLDPFRAGYYYDSKMGGSNSIKVVLPALYPDDPELDYHALPVVHHGGEAMEIYPVMLKADPKEKERIRVGLLQYCCLDTYAMVKILRKLKESI